MTWQLVLVALVEALAVAYVVYALWPKKRRPRLLTRPDVKVDQLVRRKPPREPDEPAARDPDG